MQVLNADAIVVKLNSGDYKTIHLSSIRPPRLEGENTQVKNRKLAKLLCKNQKESVKWYMYARVQKDTYLRSPTY